MTRARIVAAGLAGLTGFAAGFYLALASVMAVVGFDDPFETQLELTALVFGTAISVLAVSAASGRFAGVIGRVASAASTHRLSYARVPEVPRCGGCG